MAASAVPALPPFPPTLYRSFVDATFPAAEDGLSARLIANIPEKCLKVTQVIEQELQHCTSFDISVAFVRLAGIEPLLQTLLELEARGIPGRFLTTDYQTFTEPAALKTLAKLRNIEVRMYRCEGSDGFHTKGYIFDRAGECRIIIGSSNFTKSALTLNREWNTRLVVRQEGAFAAEVREEFARLWDSKHAKPLADVLPAYEAEYRSHLEALAQIQKLEEETRGELKPNAMQQAFVTRLLAIRDKGEKRALLISATGTGKTYAAAFGAKALAPKRLLFLVHREQIARQAMASFRRVLGEGYTYGILSGNEKEIAADCVFATMQTASKPEVMEQLGARTFDLIIIDEVHRAGAKSYQSIMAWFEPALWLGMTASPDRTDGFDIYGLFGHNIAYEIRLRTALEENLLCPFHYFGITDLEAGGRKLDDLTLFSRLTSDERVKHILSRADFFGFSGERVKGLVFCSSKKECEELSRKFNESGRCLRTLALSGDDPQSVREAAIDRLTNGSGENRLDYIFTVDIFNEGVDIPDVNQVILLRPTESAIVFIQQLGRGLRKAPGKDFVVILDFIGNCESNYLIPVALSDDYSYSKDTMRRIVATGSSVIPGASSIHFDEKAREQIYAAIDTARTNRLALLEEAYRQLKFKLGRIPRLADYEEHGSIDPVKFFSMQGKPSSYRDFLAKCEPGFKEEMTDAAALMLRTLSSRLGPGKRVSEALVLLAILEHPTAGQNLLPRLASDLRALYGIEVSPDHLENVFLVLSNGFCTNANEKERLAACEFVAKAGPGDVRAAPGFLAALQENPALSVWIRELALFVKGRYEKRYARRYGGTDFVLYEKYSYEEVCRLLNWTRNMNAQNIGGYFYDQGSKTLPVFINYEKTTDAIAYHDRFVSESEIIALSKKKRRTDSPDANHFYKRTPEDRENRIYLFVRRNKDDQEAKSFYFLGEVEAAGDPAPVTLEDGSAAFEIRYRLDKPVRDDIYQFITGA